MNTIHIVKGLAALAAVLAIFYTGMRFERVDWLQKEIEQRKALQIVTDRVLDAERTAFEIHAEKAVSDVKNSKLTNELANVNRVATERLRIIANRDVTSRETITTTGNSNGDATKSAGVLSVGVDEIERLIFGSDRLYFEADEINNAYLSCRAQ